MRSETVSTSCLIVVSHCCCLYHKRSNQASESREITAPEISKVEFAAAATKTKTKPGKLACVHKQKERTTIFRRSRVTENSSHRESEKEKRQKRKEKKRKEKRKEEKKRRLAKAEEARSCTTAAAGGGKLILAAAAAAAARRRHGSACWPAALAAAARRRLRPLAAAQPALRPSAAWPLRGLRPLRPLRGQRPLRGHSGRCAASLVPAAAGSSGGDAAHLQQQQQQHLVLRCVSTRQLTMHEIENRPCTKLRIQSMKFWSNRLKIETRNSKLETEN